MLSILGILLNILLRILIILVFSGVGYFAGRQAGFPPAAGAVAGVALGALTVGFERLVAKAAIGSIVTGVLGLATGIFTSVLILIPVKGILGNLYGPVSFAVSAMLGYGGLLAGFSKGKKLTLSGIFRAAKGQVSDEHLKILDTSVIIDGRISDICDSGFLDGGFIVPQFILQELQHIADSPDSLKRARGRRGLDVLHRIQKMSHISVDIVEQDFPKIREVDAKLVALAKVINAKVITNDFNLNKVAELQGVSVLNINELANAIKPVVLPGETLKVFVIKEGKEHNQGVAYLDDGTMVVVDNGRKLLGRTIEVTVTSVLQTTAGRMIFTKTREDYDREELKEVK